MFALDVMMEENKRDASKKLAARLSASVAAFAHDADARTVAIGNRLDPNIAGGRAAGIIQAASILKHSLSTTSRAILPSLRPASLAASQAATGQTLP